MPAIQFTFPQVLNVSVQRGDIAYYVPTSTSSTFKVNSSDIIEIGVITEVLADNMGFTCYSTLVPAMYPGQKDYLFFAKNNKVNQSNALGYYGGVDIRNNSKEEAEIFAVSADYFDSSK